MAVHACDLTYMGGISRRIVVLGQPWAKTKEPI
jgi:hypothetical protein